MILEGIGDRGRAIGWALFFSGIMLAWWIMFTMAGMSGLNVFGEAVSANMMPMQGVHVLFPMWAIMMLAMMGPTLAPVLVSFEGLINSGYANRAGWMGLIVGYALAWFGFAGTMALVQTALFLLELIDLLGAATVRWLQAAILFAVGGYQFTRAKEVCQGICLSPTLYFLGRWRPGFRGGLRMGMGFGAYCVACCWGFMMLGFVGGTMNLSWMGLATAVMILEKLPEVAAFVTRPLGIILMVFGLLLAGGIL